MLSAVSTKSTPPLHPGVLESVQVQILAQIVHRTYGRLLASKTSLNYFNLKDEITAAAKS